MSVNFELVSAADVRTYIGLSSPASADRFGAGEIGSNTRAAVYWLERLCRRLFADRPNPTTLKFTTSGQANVYLPGLRSASSVLSLGTALTEDNGYWLRPDSQQSGVFTGIQLRAYRGRGDGPWFLNHADWWDRNLDSPWHPANRLGGDYGLPNDLVITGAWGYAAGEEPPPLLHASKVLSAWFTQRGNSLLGGVAADPSGNVVDYSKWPSEVISFVNEFGIGEQAAVIG